MVAWFEWWYFADADAQRQADWWSAGAEALAAEQRAKASS
jgi:hypothetical protein